MDSAAASPARGLDRPLPALLLILAVTIAFRLAALPAVGPEMLSPDGARFLNLARSLERGLGYVTPEAWPAWLEPARLPAPETFKEPGYPVAIAAAKRLVPDPFRAAQGVSLLAGLLSPLLAAWLVFSLARDRRAALFAGLLTAASPVLIRQSVYVMAESLFAMLLLGAFACAALRPRGAGRQIAFAFAAGLALGLAYLVRAQALLAVPAMVGLAWGGRARNAALRSAAIVLAVAALAAAPWWLRNLRLFGDPFHSDVAPFAIWPFVDDFAFAHLPIHPPSPLAFALAHPAEVLAYSAGSLKRFAWHTLPHDLLSSRIWLVPFAIGGLLALAKWRAWWPAIFFSVATAAFLFPLNWVERYFAAVAPLAAAFTALGTAWLFRGADEGAGASPWPGRLAIAGFAVLLALGGIDAIGSAGRLTRPERIEAQAAGPFLRQRLAADEAAMVEVTSYWAWYSDRPVVLAVIGDDRKLREVARRYHVRAAAFTESFEREYVGRLPAARLPDWFVPWSEQPVPGVRFYDVKPE